MAGGRARPGAAVPGHDGDAGFYAIGKKGITVRVKVKPGAREDRVLGVRGAELHVSVRAAPERGKANEEVIRLLSRALGVGRSDVVLRIGGGASRKVFEVPAAALEALKRMEAGEGKGEIS